MALAAHNRTARDAVAARFGPVRAMHSGDRFTVFAAHERGTRGMGRDVAVKVPTDAATLWLREVLDGEAAMHAAIGAHPNVVELYDRLDLDDDRPALVFERCAASYADLLHRYGRLPLPDVVAVGIKLAGALEAVHDAGYVHGDLRPANVLLSEQHEPVLSGFDEASLLSAAADRDPTALHVTSPHTAPELLEGRAPTRATDVYGLASTLYELVAGRAAFRAYVGESPASVVVRVLSGRVKPIVSPDIPLELSDLLTWALNGNPVARPPTPAWIAEELSRLERRQGWPRTPLLSA
jgi:serine/threonine protein kinase